MDIDLIAELKPAGQFFTLYQDGDEKKSYDGKSLLIRGLMNTDPDSRYAIASFLLERDALIGPVASDGATALHVLFGHVRHDVARDQALARRLIARNVNINALDVDNELAFQLILNMKYLDDDLAPIYDLWFEQPVLDFTTKNKWGFSPIDLAEKVPYRSGIAARMKEYVRDHNA